MIEEIVIAIVCGLASLVGTLITSNTVKKRRIKLLKENLYEINKKKTEILSQKEHIEKQLNKSNELMLPLIEEINPEEINPEEINPEEINPKETSLGKGNLKTIGIINHKGGVGKTSVAFHLGFYLSRFHNRKVLLVDLDPQGNLSVLTLGTGINVWRSIEGKPTSLEGLINEYVGNNKINKYGMYISPHNRFTEKKGLKVDIIPQVGWFNFKHRFEEYNLGLLYMRYIDVRNIWKNIKSLKDTYDVIIFDCPPNLGFLTQSALLYSDFIFTPVVLDDFSFFGFKVVMEWIEDFSKKLKIPTKQINSLIINRTSRHNGGLINTQEANLNRIKQYEKNRKIKLLPPDNTFISGRPSMFSNLLDSGPVFSGNRDFMRQFGNLTNYLVSLGV